MFWEESLFQKEKMLKPTTLLKVTLLHVCFSRFLNCRNDTKSRKASHINILCKKRSEDEYHETNMAEVITLVSSFSPTFCSERCAGDEVVK